MVAARPAHGVLALVQDDAVEGLRTFVGMAVVLMVVAFLVQVPVRDADLLPVEAPDDPATPPTPTATPPTPGTGTGLPGKAEGRSRALRPSSLVGVHPLDPLTLVPRTEASVAVVHAPVQPIPVDGAALLLEVDPDPGPAGERVRLAAPPTAPDRWAELWVAPDTSVRAWLGASRTTVAWALADGRLHVQSPGSPTPRAVVLPAGRTVLEGAFVDDALLALLLRPAPTTADDTLSLLLVDTDTLEVRLDRPLPGLHDPSRRPGAEAAWLHAWDVQAGHLHLLEVASGALSTVDLGTGVRSRPVHPLAPPSGGPVALLAGWGRVVLHRVAEDPRAAVEGGAPSPQGVVVLDADLRTLASRPELTVREAALAEDGSLLVRPANGGFAVLGPDLQPIGLSLMHGPHVTLLGIEGRIGYLTLHTGDLPHQWLVAVDLPTATITASQMTDRDAVYTPAGSLLLVPER